MPLEEITTATRHLFLCVGPDCASQPWAKPSGAFSKPKRANSPSRCFEPRRPACASAKRAPGWLCIQTGSVTAALNSDKLRRILKEHIEEGTPVREWIAAEMPNLAKPADTSGRASSLLRMFVVPRSGVLKASIIDEQCDSRANGATPTIYASINVTAHESSKATQEMSSPRHQAEPPQ